MPNIEISQAESESDLRSARELLQEYCDWVVSVEKEAIMGPPLQGLQDEIKTLPSHYALPKGRLLLLKVDRKPAGCVCLKPREQDMAEVKRLYVRPAFRGMALGRKLVERIVEEGRKEGYKRLILDSHVSMTSAHRLYREAGFTATDPFPGYPEHLVPVALFMALNLR